MVPLSDTYTFYLTADDAANLAINHTLLINASDVCCIEHRASVYLLANTFYQISLEYQQLTGSAAVSLLYSSSAIRKQVGCKDSYSFRCHLHDHARSPLLYDKLYH